MSDKRIIIKINFNNINYTPESLTKEWVDYRMSIFMNYTLKSLKAQTNQDFKVFVLYNPVTEEYIQQAIACFEPLPDNIYFITETELDKKIIEYIDGYEKLYYVYQESDDMYRTDFIQLMHDYTLQNKDNIAIMCPYGYMYDSIRNRLIKFYTCAPAFCVYIYKVKDFKEGLRHLLSKGWFTTREYPHEVFKDPCYINHSHGKNTVPSFKMSCFEKAKKEIDAWGDHPDSTRVVIGPEITDKYEIKRILEEFTGRG